MSRPAAVQDQWERALRLVAEMRTRGTSLQAARINSGLSRTAAMRLVGSALRKHTNGRYVAKRHDRLLRVLVVPAVDGLTEVAVRDSREATRIGEYLNAVHRYLSRGDETDLQTFRKQPLIRLADGSTLRLITDTPTLDELGGAGVLSFQSIYARSK